MRLVGTVPVVVTGFVVVTATGSFAELVIGILTVEEIRPDVAVAFGALVSRIVYGYDVNAFKIIVLTSYHRHLA